MSKDPIYKKEQAIGRKAARMAQDYLHTVLRQKLSIRGEGYEKIKPILDATRVQPKMGDYRLQGLNLQTSKIGFILHFGFSGVRQGGDVYLQAARYNKQKTKRDAHQVDLSPRSLFDDIYEKSGAIDYLLAALQETRTEAHITKLQNLAIKLNDPGNGQ